ncbi:hypothetical protein HRED_08945 [Candidatus Haloredivivus sp. G17]|nr:hypothetical protein HRED_08945 [Candidatus Haloredivivus sp. G17]
MRQLEDEGEEFVFGDPRHPESNNVEPTDPVTPNKSDSRLLNPK